MAQPYKLRFGVITHDFVRFLEFPGYVTMPINSLVDDLRKEVKREASPRLDAFSTLEMHVWKNELEPDDEVTSDRAALRALLDRVKPDLKARGQGLTELSGDDVLSDWVWQTGGKHIHFLVQLPDKGASFLLAYVNMNI